MLKLHRSEKNPILTPSELPWENMLVFNPGAIIVGDSVYLIYRAIGKSDLISRFGLAISRDGITFERKQEPLYSGGGHPEEAMGIEDPRVVQIEDTYYLTYTAVSNYQEKDKIEDWSKSLKPMIALSTTKDFKTFHDYDVIITDDRGKNASFFPKKISGEYWLLHREGSGKTFFSRSPIFTSWPEKKFVFEERPEFWDSKKTGIGAPPIYTDKGWLLFYHGVDELNTYRLGIMFLDLEDPTKILYRSSEPILEPEMDYEKTGYVGNVVFICGAVEKNEQYYVYYGAADMVIGLATIDKKSVLALF